MLYQPNQFAFQRAEQVKYVNGPESARAYQMPPCSSAVLMDSGRDRFYFKETDAAGIATVRTYDFAEAKPEEKPYVTKEELEVYVDELVEKAVARAASEKPVGGGKRG